MKPNLITIFFIILFSNVIIAQEKNKESFNSIVSFSTFSPTVYFAPRLNLGYIRKMNEKYWLGLEIGYGNKNISVNYADQYGYIKNSYKIFEIKPEIYYDLRPKSKLKHLLSLEFQYIKHTDQFNNDSYYDLDRKTNFKFDRTDYQRIKYGIGINYNLITNISKKLALFHKIGIGFRKREVLYSNIINKIEDESYQESDTFVIPSVHGFLYNGTSNSFNFNLDLKLIYKF